MLNKSEENTPYYQQIREMLLEEIKSGKLKHGDKIPSERELSETLKISRMTIRHAIDLLEREGVVERRPRVGTFVANRRIRWNFITVNSFTKGMIDKGFKPSTKKIHMLFEKADEHLAKALDIDVGEEVFSLKRLRIVDEIPIAIELSQIPYKYCQGIEKYMEDNASLYEVLAQKYGIQLKKQKQRMKISYSNSSESKLLQLKPESPCLWIQGTTHDMSGRIIEYTNGLARGDLVEFYSEPTNPS